MDKVDYVLDEHVAIMSMNSGENRFNFPFFKAINSVLDEIEQNPDVKVLVTKSSDPKIWCNGIDLDWLLPAQKEDPGVGRRFSAEMFGLMKRVLGYPMLTIAAITGHAFAGGAFLSFAHDFRFMRSDRGWLCLPEVDIGMTLGPVFSILSKRVMSQSVFEEMQYTGVRFTAEECVEHHIVRKACHIDDLMDEAMAYAKSLSKDRELIEKMKMETHKASLAIIDDVIASMA